MDNVSKLVRSATMSRVRSKNTAPEMVVRRLVHCMGFRYRLHLRALPGCPDLVFPRTRKVIFVHGCFWHLHPGCPNARRPTSRTDYWKPKLDANRRRDKVHERQLRKDGWDVLTVWECEVEGGEQLKDRLRSFLTPSAQNMRVGADFANGK
jgi:DNA mismatch endonuclease (patch repair protein)